MPISCKVCDAGTLKPKRIHKRGGASVFIGQVFLLGSILMLAFCGSVMSSAVDAGAAAKARGEEANAKVADQMRASTVPEPIVQQVAAGKRIGEIDMATLSEVQRQAVRDGVASYHAHPEVAGAVAAGGVGLLAAGPILFAVFVLLLGFVLTSKRKVLKCTSCGAVTDAA